MRDPAVRILLIEDDPILGGAIAQRLKLEGFDVEWVKSRAEALAAMKRKRPCFVLSDIVLPDGSGEDLYRAAQPFLGDTPILFATAFGEIDQAVRLMKAGADDYVTKPYDADDLVGRIRQRLEGRAQHQEGDAAKGFALSPVTEAVAEQLRRVANTDLTILIKGETGTGKEVAARYMHSVSTRSSQPFVAVNCGAIPRELLESQFFGHERGSFTGASQAHVGFFEEAGDGTLFLDEIGELDAQLQTALLRVLQDGCFRPIGSRKDRRFAGRVVAATNADLDRMREEKKFRDDLYFRLSVIEIVLPPLRDRIAEIAPLAEQFLQDVASRNRWPVRRLADSTLQMLVRHDWPGNIRELRNRLERASVLAAGETLEPGDVFPELALNNLPPASLAQARKQAEADQIERALTLSRGRVGEAAKRLGISRTTLWKRRAKQDGQ